MRRPFLAAMFALSATALLVASATACTIDGKASAFANGVRAVIVKTGPTVATYSWWAHFAFPGAVRVHERVKLREDDAQVRKVLPGAEFKRSWRWRFGDGQTVVGDTVSHVYARPGRYKIRVDTYYPRIGWATFDMITITVRR